MAELFLPDVGAKVVEKKKLRPITIRETRKRKQTGLSVGDDLKVGI